ncbi:AAA domain-containing protein [Runella sp.]|uniref:AAA domain-containing protein n=1 Tax=Runella sp. TaxID=1960881 RepID=UPI003D135EC1
MLTADILKIYLRRLTNLSTRNRSLLLTNLPAEQFLDWQELDFLDGHSAFDVLKDVLSQKKTVKLCQRLDSRSEKVNEISKRLTKLTRTERFIEEERGSEDLYVAYPFVRGKLMDGTVIHAPLAFFPVTLQQLPNNSKAPESLDPQGDSVPGSSKSLNGPVSGNSEGAWKLYRREEPAALNRSFLLAYGHFNQVKISEELLEKSLDELSKEPLAFRTELYELLKNSSLDINFNQDLFQDTLQFFDGQSKPDLDLLERNGELKLYPEAVLGIFPQTGSYLGPDYEVLIDEEDNEQEEESEPFFFPVSTPTSYSFKEEQTFTAFPQDATQEAALKRVKQGESLVVQGPPGTGKSQLISNLMADFAARGMRVLLVCQKRVALDVVHQRLAQVGMSPFLALVHDFKNDRAALYGQLTTQIENVEAYQKQNYSLDSIVLERQFLQTSRSIEQISNELEAFKKALFNSLDCGISPKELYLTSDPTAPHIAMPYFKAFRFDEKLDVFLQKLRRYESYQAKLGATHPWHNRVGFSQISFQEIPQIDATIEEVLSWNENLKTKTQRWVGEAFTVERALQTAKQKDKLQQWSQPLEDENVWALFRKWEAEFITKEKIKWFKNATGEMAELQSKRLLGPEVPSSQLSSFSTRLQNLITARGSLLKWPFYGDKAYFRPLVATYGLGLDLGDLYKLNDFLSNRLRWEQLLKEIGEKLEIPILTEQFGQSENNYQDFLTAYATAQEAFQGLETNFGFVRKLVKNSATFSEFSKKTKALITLCEQTAQKYGEWQKYLTKMQISLLLENPTSKDELQQILHRDFDLLTEADTLKGSFSAIEAEICQGLEILPSHGNTGLVEHFQNSLRLAWLAQLEELYPILRSVSSLKISQLEQELQDAILQKQSLSREILLMQLREQTGKNVEFNRLQNRVTYRELQHQVTKKRKIWPVRKLMEQHAEEVFRLVPCWLASPETVSAVFPLTKGLFDLVIFDEASQCYAEYGIPAIYRAKQTVVVGDSKQLTPYDLYRVRYEGENEDERPALEAESLLDLAKQFLPETLLQGHYRSRSLDLIDFSNQHFYKNKLQLLPHFDDVNRQEPAIQFIKVDGIWEGNRNQIEAEKVVELLQELQQTYPNHSIGIVTFNLPQQQLIENLILQPSGIKGAANSHSLFIKNIENVQGDERDIIVFSVGYAPDVQGKLRAQFGSLNGLGGENRLNVAVTRAREKVYVVTSILPEELKVEDTLHEGPKLLKAYLQYALNVSEGNYAPQPFVSDKYRSEWLLKNQLMKNGKWKTKDQTEEGGSPTSLHFTLPFADLTVKNDEHYESVILTDDELYQQAVSAKESHAYLPLQLRAKGWSFERVWSREWWRKR